MIKKTLLALLLVLPLVSFAAPQQRFDISILPIFNNSFELGTTTLKWFRSWISYSSSTQISTNSLCLNADTCRTTWPSSSGGSGSGNVATSTQETSGFWAYWTSTGATPATLGATSTPYFSAFNFGNATGTAASTTNLFSTTASTTNLWGTLIQGFGLSTCSGSNFLQWSGGVFGCSTPAGSGDVSSGSTLTDNAVVRGDGGAKGVQTSGVIIDDSNNVTGVVQLTVTSSTTLQNFTFVNATGTSATTTSFFSTTASSTSLFSTSGNIGSLVLSAALPVTSGGTGLKSISSARVLVTTGANVIGTNSNFQWDDTNGGFIVGLSTTTNATTTGSSSVGLRASSTSLTVSGVKSALHLADSIGGVSAYGGAAACTNQFVTAISAIGGTTCASINNAQWSGTALSVGNGGTGLQTFGGVNTVLYTTAADTLASNTNFVFNSAITAHGVGTSTPRWSLQVASSTGAQLTISDGSLTSNHWSFRNNGGNFFLSTSSPTTFATSTASAFAIDANGFPLFSSLGGTTGCAQFDSVGKLSNTGAACGTSAASAASKWSTSTADTLAIFPTTALRVGIGTTTPRWALQIASSTGAQLTLSDPSTITNDHWSFRNAGGVLYIATSSATTFATNTLAALTISNTGSVGVLGLASSTPWGNLSINPIAGQATWALAIGSSTAFSFGIDAGGRVGFGGIVPTTASPLTNWLTISTSTGAFPLLLVNATSTGPWFASSTAYTDVNFGTSTNPAGDFANVTVAGSIDMTDQVFWDDYMGQINSTTTDSSGTNWRNGLNFDIDGACTASSPSGLITGMIGVLKLQTGNSGGNGCHLDFGNTNNFGSSSKPRMETVFSIPTATTSKYILIGFGNLAQNSTNATSSVTAGVYLIMDSTQQFAQCVVRKNATTAATTTSTWVPVANTNYKLQMGFSSSSAKFMVNGKSICGDIFDTSTVVFPITGVEPEYFIEDLGAQATLYVGSTRVLATPSF